MIVQCQLSYNPTLKPDIHHHCMQQFPIQNNWVSNRKKFHILQCIPMELVHPQQGKNQMDILTLLEKHY